MNDEVSGRHKGGNLIIRIDTGSIFTVGMGVCNDIRDAVPVYFIQDGFFGILEKDNPIGILLLDDLYGGRTRSPWDWRRKRKRI